MKPLKARDITYIALSAALISVCSWITIPGAVPFTLQTFAVFFTVGLLGGRRGALAIVVYLLLGAAGAPVFHGFTGGIGILFGNLGGYLFGFLAAALVVWLITGILGDKTPALAVAMAAGMLVCYAFGTAWFMAVYVRESGAVSLATVLGWCVFPFLLPDGVKITLAVLLTARLKRRIPGLSR